MTVGAVFGGAKKCTFLPLYGLYTHGQTLHCAIK